MAAGELGFPLALKVQVLTGGRGKAGGTRVVRGPDEFGEAVPAILGLTIKGKPVHAVPLEQFASVLRELYLAITLDRHAKSPLVIVSTRGGLDIEQAAKDDPGALLRLPLNACSEACDDVCQRVVEAADLGHLRLDAQPADMVRRPRGAATRCGAGAGGRGACMTRGRLSKTRAGGSPVRVLTVAPS